MSERASHTQLRRPLGDELDKELSRLSLLGTRIWQIMTVLGLGLSFAIGRVLAPKLGVACAIASAVFLAWFTAQAELQRRGLDRGLLGLAGIAVEGTIPWVFMLAIAAAQGPAYALGSWVPPLLFACIIIVATVRLQPVAPLVLGICGGAALLGLYFGFVRPELTPEQAALPLYRPTMQISRALSLVFGGALAAWGAGHLRRAIARADRAARERELFGKYQLDREIASGGMGTVYQATYCPEGGFERPVAVKRIHPHLAAQQRFVDAFRFEAELSARLVHRNIVQVLDLGRIDGNYFLAMEYVEGMTLRQLMRRTRGERMDVDEAVVAYLGLELLAGLSFSHEGARAADGTVLRVVHRDMCPANVLLSSSGEVKISDFGVAKALYGAETSETKTVVGHAAYMSPEQAWGDPIDQRSDLFAVAVILWELLCGRPLFARTSEGKTFFAIVTDEAPRATAIRPALDPGWDAFLARGLQKELDQRFASASEMAAELCHVVPAATSEALARLVREAANLPEPEDNVEELATGDEMPTHVPRSA